MDYSDAFTRVQQQRVDGLFLFAVFHTIVREIPESFVTNDHHATILKPVVQQLEADIHGLYCGQLCYLCVRDRIMNNNERKIYCKSMGQDISVFPVQKCVILKIEMIHVLSRLP